MANHRIRRVTASQKFVCLWMGCLILFLCPCAQYTELTHIASDPNHSTETLPSFFGKDSVIGSPYLVSGWLRGVLYLTSQKCLPEPGHGMFFNYDKLHERLYATDGRRKPWVIANDTISRFTLADSNTLYSFEKIPRLSRSHLFQLLVRSENGYTVYKRIVTKIIPATYHDGGYFNTGNRFEQYVDIAEYLIFFRGNIIYRKPTLTVRTIKKSLRSESARLNKFFAQDYGSVDEHTFVLLMEFLNQQNGFD